MTGKGQYITLKDLKKYPRLYEEAIKYLDLGYDEIGAQDIRIVDCMRSWYHHPFGRDFWRDISYGVFDTILRRSNCYKVAPSVIVELFNTDSLELLIINNGLFVCHRI